MCYNRLYSRIDSYYTEELPVIAALYLAVYIGCGLLCVRLLLPRHAVLNRIWLGVSFGLLLMMWLPALMAFAFKFSVQAHVWALVPLALVTLGCYLGRDRRSVKPWDGEEAMQLVQLLLIAFPLTVLSGYLQWTHSLRPGAGGAWYVGQSTYGDLPMHTAFITGLKDSGFPPEYPFYPGHRLSYPFLMDTLSTTFYLFGWSLQASLAVPGTLMMGLCYMGVMLLAREMTLGKKTVVLATLLFFLNGGLGFLYDFDQAAGYEADGSLTVWSRLENILQGWYQTPVNKPDPDNLRWSNVIVDLMIPQRTLLGGWCMVIPCFYLLYTAYEPTKRERLGGLRAVLLLGVWGGALPLIQTHAFLALGLCAVGMLVYDMTDNTRFVRPMLLLSAGAAGGLGYAASRHLSYASTYQEYVQAGSAYGMERSLLGMQQTRPLLIVTAILFITLALNFAVQAVLCAVRDRERFRRLSRQMGDVICRYLPFGVLAVVLAAPQLFGFTFGQTFMSAEEGIKQHSFITFQFNWVNNPGGKGMRDFYFWFYVKNLGIPVIGLILALFEKDKRTRRIFAGAFVIILAAELVRFQPNEYDNNKLFYLAWLLCCMIVADYAAKIWRRLKGLGARPLIAVIAAVVLFLSAGLSIARECVSNYQAFGAGAVEAGEWVRDNTEEDAVFLTGNHHLNPVASVAGRTIVCGPDLWLYWHGFDTSQRKAQVKRFYENPAENTDVLEAYGVDYIYVSSYERSSYTVDRAALDEMYDKVFENSEATVWKAGND